MQQRTDSMVNFDEAYIRFCEEAALSEDRELQILEILAEVQSTFARHTRGSRAAIKIPSMLAKLAMKTITEAEQRLRMIMTPQEQAAWQRHLEPISPFSRLCYGEPLALVSSAE